MSGKMVDRIMDSAAGMGAEELITACPLCLYNLNTSTSANKLPVHYFTELLAEALGLKEEVQE
jgi:heterodisulfide reductase subunit B